MSHHDQHSRPHDHPHTDDVPPETSDGNVALGGDIDRRGFLSCMSWAGAGMLWTMRGGIARSALLGAELPTGGELTFVQISDSHIGFDKAANTDVTATMRAAVAKVDALAARPAFILHTGDISQLARPSEFDTADQVLRESRTRDVFFVPGEHDVATDAGASYMQRYGRRMPHGATGSGWYSFDHSGVHFIGLVNVLDLRPGGLGALGRDQLEWLERDVKPLASSTPIVVFAHVPLWTIAPEWGWGTEDSSIALGYLRRFGSVTVLNGHIHQTMQKVEGNIAFHTALSTAFPQPRPGTAPAPAPMVVPAGHLRDVLGVRDVQYLPHARHLAVVDATLSGQPAEPAMAMGEANARTAAAAAKATTPSAAAGAVLIDNFAFTPRALRVRRGQTVTWTNHDDVPHRIQSANAKFAPSTVLDTKASYTVTLADAGEFPYFCSLHPTMTGTILVQDG